MSTNENDDYELFLYYLEHNHLPDSNNTKNSKKRKEEYPKNLSNDKKLIENNKEKNNSLNSKKESNIEEENRTVWLNYLKNANFSNYEKPVYTKRQTHHNTKKIKLNKITPNDILDLHGTKYKDAKKELDMFFHRCSYKNYNCVLIIHGKGYGSEDGYSVLKRLVEEYLIEHKDSYKIKTYIEAPKNLGGSGAKIVFFKR